MWTMDPHKDRHLRWTIYSIDYNRFIYEPNMKDTDIIFYAYLSKIGWLYLQLNLFHLLNVAFIKAKWMDKKKTEEKNNT